MSSRSLKHKKRKAKGRKIECFIEGYKAAHLIEFGKKNIVKQSLIKTKLKGKVNQPPSILKRPKYV